MNINEILSQDGWTKYRLAKQSGVPHATLNDLCSGKTCVEKCSGETLYRLARTLGIPMEMLLEDTMREKVEFGYVKNEREQSYECGLPPYLHHDLQAYKAALKDGSTLLDCLWGELYGSINAAEIDDGLITPEQADYLRQRYLWR